jgi:hypothetical protein
MTIVAFDLCICPFAASLLIAPNLLPSRRKFRSAQSAAIRQMSIKLRSTKNRGDTDAQRYIEGPAVYWLDDKIDPEINIWLGNEIGAAVDLAISIVSTIVADFTPPTGSEETTATQDDWDWTPD